MAFKLTLLILLLAAPGAAPAARAQTRRPAHNDRAAAERLLAEAAAAIERGDEAAAKSLSERALAADPDNVTALTYLGALADHAGDLREAERRFAAAAIAAPTSAQARNNHGAILLRLGRVEQAAAQFEVSLRLDRNQPSPLVNLARIRFDSGTPDGLRRALTLFERAYALAPDIDIARALVVTSLRLGDAQSAAKFYREYSARLDPADARVGSAAARAELGGALLDAGLVEDAARELSAASQADPSNVEALVRLARAHLKRKDVAAAGRLLEGAVARGVDAAPVYAALADVYEAGGYVENAIPAMRLAIERDPRNENYRLRYGLMLNDTKAPGAAIIRLREALQEFPNSSPLWLALGIAQGADGKADDARKSFERALELDPRSVPALAYLGSTYGERGQYAEAAALYERAIDAGPNFAAPYYLAADAMLKQPAFDAARAERHLTRAVEIEPDFASARLALGKLYVRQERWTEAAAEFERVTRLDPQSADARYQLGRVYVRLKRPADAQRELDTFKQLSEAQKEKRETDRRDLLRRLAHVNF
ncbi:MAG: tetratricopeptide repeat protein [Pyrinomonadaceae bacterium]